MSDKNKQRRARPKVRLTARSRSRTRGKKAKTATTTKMERSASPPLRFPDSATCRKQVKESGKEQLTEQKKFDQKQEEELIQLETKWKLHLKRFLDDAERARMNGHESFTFSLSTYVKRAEGDVSKYDSPYHEFRRVIAARGEKAGWNVAELNSQYLRSITVKWEVEQVPIEDTIEAAVAEAMDERRQADDRSIALAIEAEVAKAVDSAVNAAVDTAVDEFLGSRVEKVVNEVLYGPP